MPICKKCGVMYQRDWVKNKEKQAGKCRRDTLCERCWEKSLKHKGFHVKGKNTVKIRHYGDTRLEGYSESGFHGSKKQSKVLVRREREIERLKRIIDKITQENIQLKDKLKMRKWKH